MINLYQRIRVKEKVMPLHRYIMELHLGRKLRSDEIVHHKDGYKDNNESDNLEITNCHDHMKKHVILRKQRIDWEKKEKYELKKVEEMLLTGHVYREIAEELNISKGTVGRRAKKLGLSIYGYRSREVYGNAFSGINP